MIQLCFVLCFARRKVLPPTSQQQLTNKANGACIFDYLFKWKLINLNLKLIGFPACYTRVRRSWRVLHKKPEWTGGLFEQQQHVLYAAVYTVYVYIRENWDEQKKNERESSMLHPCLNIFSDVRCLNCDDGATPTAAAGQTAISQETQTHSRVSRGRVYSTCLITI